MKKPNLERIKSSLQNIEAKRLVLINDINNLKDYYTIDRCGRQYNLEAIDAAREIKDNSMRFLLELIQSLSEFEEK
jgi:hypothetical protein